MNATGLGLLAVVEDSDEDYAVVHRAFRGTTAGKRIVRYHTGEEALEHLLTDAGPDAWPGLVLLDLNLPGRRGLEVLAALKRTPAVGMVPVVIVSGSARQEDIDAAYRQGANAYLVKSLDVAEMQRALRALHDFWDVVAHPTPPHRRPPGWAA